MPEEYVSNLIQLYRSASCPVRAGLGSRIKRFYACTFTKMRPLIFTTRIELPATDNLSLRKQQATPMLPYLAGSETAVFR